MGLNPTAHNLMLTALGGVAGFVSAHTAAPTDAGLNEVVGGTYVRKAVTWNAVTGANLDSSNTPVLDIPVGVTITHLGFWSASTAGTFYGWLDIPDQTFGSAGTYTCTDLDWNLVAV